MLLHSNEAFSNEFLKLDVNLIYRASLMTLHKNKILRQFDMSWQQYNILSVLRLYHPNTINLMGITKQMIDPASNTSRLVEKLRKKGYVHREENPLDRRKVDIGITERGMQVYNEASHLLRSHTLELFASLTEREAKAVNDILDSVFDSK